MFEPRVKEAIKIASSVTVNAMIDISDGLSSDLNRICRASGIGAIIDAKQIPISDEAKNSRDPLSAALNDGEDFELLFTLSQKDCRRLLEGWKDAVPITQVGRVTKTCKLRIRDLNGNIRRLKPAGYDHLG